MAALTWFIKRRKKRQQLLLLIWRYDAGWGVIRVYEGAKSNILGATHPDCSLVHGNSITKPPNKEAYVRIYICAISCARGRNDARLIVPAMYIHCGARPIIGTNLSSPQLNQILTPLHSVSSSFLKISHVVVNDGAVSIAHFNVHSGCKRSSQTRFFLSSIFEEKRGCGPKTTPVVCMRNIMCARGRNDARLIIPAMYTAAAPVPLLTPNCRPQLNQISTPLSHVSAMAQGGT